MTKRKKAQSDPDPPALIALRRSAKIALDIARESGTACYVWEDGKIVDIAARPQKPPKSRPPSQKANKDAKTRRGSS